MLDAWEQEAAFNSPSNASSIWSSGSNMAGVVLQ